MENLGDIFNQSISNVISQGKKTREENREYIKERGVEEIFQYIIFRINLPLSKQTDYDKKINHQLDYFGHQIMHKENKKYYKNEYGMFIKATLKETEDQNNYYLSINVSFGFQPSSLNHDYNVLEATGFSSENVIVIKSNYDRRNTSIFPEDSKEEIMKKIIKLILAG